MSAEDNIATVRGIYEAFGKGDVPAILEQLTDDVDWAAETSSDAAPWYGMRKGKDEVVGFFQAIGGTVDVSVFNPKSFASNDDEVMVLIDFTMKSKETGREAAMQIFHYWHFRDGKVDHYRGTEDTAATVAMLAG